MRRLGSSCFALLLMLALPSLTYYMWISLRDFSGALVLINPFSRLPTPTVTSVTLYACWFLLQVTLQIAAPGRSGLPYKMNGWFSFWFSIGFAFLASALGWVSPTVFYDEFGPLLTTANLFAFAFSLILYAWHRERTVNPVYDYFMGVALNPRIRNFDLKFFCESRPGLILWVLGDFSLAAKQYHLHGALTTPIILVVAFQFLYVADYFFHEEAILTTWDIKYEHFGWMLCWGDLVWVPFTYTLQTHYLVRHTHNLSAPAAVAIIALNILGFLIFRLANIQKHRFRRDPKGPVWGKKPEYIRTAGGALLLTSGWWGLARHMNYFGDLLMALAWSLPAGFEHPLPYFYFVYFLILLLHRERRDHAMCLEKYGRDWATYCDKVRWRIVPGLY